MLKLLNTNIWEWLSWQWFSPAVWLAFDWANPLYLYLILAIPFVFIFRRLVNWRLRQKIEVAFYASQLKWHPISMLRYVPHFFRILFLFFLVIALARPQKTDEQIEQTSEGIDILLVIDVSESMLIEDFKPNRLEAAKKVAIDFIRGRQYDRIGIVVFAGEAYSLAPLTTDYGMLESYIAEIKQDIIPQAGTAIGTALGIATNRMQESIAKSKVAILISDGDNTGGNLDPILSAKLAAYYGIRIYSIIVGTLGEVPIKNKTTGIIKYEKNTINEATLKEIAQIGEGKFFRADNQQSLNSIFNLIDSLEKSEIKETRFKNTKDFYRIYLIWALVFLIIWLLLKSTFMSNILED